MNPAADDFAYIAKRLAEVRADRQRASGVLNSPLPEVPRRTSEVEDRAVRGWSEPQGGKVVVTARGAGGGSDAQTDPGLPDYAFF